MVYIKQMEQPQNQQPDQVIYKKDNDKSVSINALALSLETNS